MAIGDIPVLIITKITTRKLIIKEQFQKQHKTNKKLQLPEIKREIVTNVSALTAP